MKTEKNALEYIDTNLIVFDHISGRETRKNGNRMDKIIRTFSLSHPLNNAAKCATIIVQ